MKQECQCGEGLRGRMYCHRGRCTTEVYFPNCMEIGDLFVLLKARKCWASRFGLIVALGILS